MMGTLYVTQEDSFIGKTDERLTVRANKQTLLDVPLIKVDGVVILGRATVSPAVVIELLERKIALSFLRGCLETIVRREGQANLRSMMRIMAM
jgi:CRISP-associated protein Cas1